MTLSTRNALPVIATQLGLVCLTVFSAAQMRGHLLNGPKEVIRSVLEGSHAMLAAYFAQETAGTLTREQDLKAPAEASVHAAHAAHGGADFLRQINDGAQSTLTRTRKVADATKEQSVASTSIAQRAEQISQMVEETGATMKSTTETAADLGRFPSELSSLVSHFRC